MQALDRERHRFTAADLDRMAVAFLVSLLVAAPACGPEVAVGEAESTGSEVSTGSGQPSSTGSSADTAGTSTSSSTSTTATATSTSTTDDDGESGSSCQFICPGDFPGGIECDPWLEDCPRGEKCMPWANDGGNTWNALKCVPIDPDPKQLGEPCTVEGSGVSGIDDCDIHSMCWYVDPETNTGNCIGFCLGTPDEPFCADPCTTCVISGAGVLTICLPTCNPVGGSCTCPDGEGCYPINEDFACFPTDGGGVYGEPCEFVNACDPGLFCAPPEAVPGCGPNPGCCSDFCDLTVADPDAQCTGAAQGQVCTPWYAEGQAPPGYDNVGACTLP